MDVVRNFIHVIGITPEEKLPVKIRGQMIQYSDIDTIFIPDGLPPAKSIFEAALQVEVKSGRIIETPIFKTMVVDGVKNFKIMYTGDGGSDKANFVSVTVPYNTFIEMPKDYDDIDKVDVFILDAYFSLLDSRRIYSYILYLVSAGYGPHRTESIPETEIPVPAQKVPETSHKMPEETVREMLLSRAAPEDSPSPVPDNIVSGSDEPDLDAEYL